MIDITLLNGDFITQIDTVKDKSIDLVLTDPPYGKSACKWDSVIPIDIMWDKLNRVVKDSGVIILFGIQPFASDLVISNKKAFKYELIWDKHIPRNFINAKIMPMQKHENVLVFYKKGNKYNPQMTLRDKPVKVKNYSKKGKDSAYQLNSDGSSLKEYVYTHRHPDTIISNCWQANKGKVHPTQKPVSLMEYLIKTYTDEYDTVLDFAMGSGTTGIASKKNNRNFIGIEIDSNYFSIAKKRIEEIQ